VRDFYGVNFDIPDVFQGFRAVAESFGETLRIRVTTRGTLKVGEQRILGVDIMNQLLKPVPPRLTDALS
jgi:hypothetical protein